LAQGGVIVVDLHISQHDTANEGCLAAEASATTPAADLFGAGHE